MRTAPASILLKETMALRKTILLVDDDADTIELLKIMFKFRDFHITSAMTSEDGLRYAKEGGFAAIILDNKLTDNSGANLCKEIREFDSQTPIIFFSGLVLERDREEGLSAGAQAYLIKPDDVENIADIVIQNIKLKLNQIA